jgi:glucose/arabinose dehydrogenase
MAFVTSNRYPDWYGHLLIGSFEISIPELVKLKGNEIIGDKKLVDIGRLRNVAQGPDGYIYIGVEGKGNSKITPISMLTTKLTLGLAIFISFGMFYLILLRPLIKK